MIVIHEDLSIRDRVKDFPIFVNTSSRYFDWLVITMLLGPGLDKDLPREPWSKLPGLSRTASSLHLVRVNLLARHSIRVSNVSTVGVQIPDGKLFLI